MIGLFYLLVIMAEFWSLATEDVVHVGLKRFSNIQDFQVFEIFISPPLLSRRDNPSNKQSFNWQADLTRSLASNMPGEGW